MAARDLAPLKADVLPVFPVGYHAFSKHQHLNFELNRCYSIVGAGYFADITAAGAGITDFPSYIQAMFALAAKARAAGETYTTAMFLRNAEFFMGAEDPRRQPTYEEFRALFNQALPEVHASRFLVPYAGSYLPGWHLRTEGPPKATLLVHGGFDSLLEELYCFMPSLQKAGIEIYAFEGPGQGAALKDYHLPMTHEWEKPVKAILDHFKLEEVAILGISLGGYLASRAAAFERRITRLIAFDVLYDFFETAMRTQPPVVRLALRAMLKIGAKGVVNTGAKWAASRDFLSNWGIHQGMYIFSVDTPYDFLTAISKMTLKGVAPLIRQEAWLCAGESDHMVPLWMLDRQKREMTASVGVHTRVFTDAEHAGSHCQIGNFQLAMDFIVQSLLR